jgi:hypothetical protein
MRRIKLFESFYDLTKLTDDVSDILVELGDIKIEWQVSTSKRKLVDGKYVNLFGIEIYKEPTEVDDDEDFDWGYDAGREETNLFDFEDIYEPVMTLLSFMRDKYPDMTFEPLMTVNNLPETDDWFEEFLEENDLESVTLDEVKQFTNISSFDIEFTI